MGYTTDFSGELTLSKPLTEGQQRYYDDWSQTRRVKRDVSKLQEQYDGNYSLDGDYGTEGEYFGYVPSEVRKNYEETHDWTGSGYGDWISGHTEESQVSELDGNKPPSTQPGLWCGWEIKDDTLQWDGSEKFYHYQEWLQYVIDNFMERWDISLDGEVKWTGEDDGDIGKIVVTENQIEVQDVDEFENEVTYHPSWS